MLNLGGEVVDTRSPKGSMLFTVMAALAQMELDIKRERIIDSVAKRRVAGKDLGGRRQLYTASQLRTAWRAGTAVIMPTRERWMLPDSP